MTKKELKKDLQKNKLNITLHVLNQAEKLGIKYEFIYKIEKKFHFRLSYKNKHIYLVNACLYHHTDKLSVFIVSNKDLVKKILDKIKIKTPQGFVIKKFSEIKPLLNKNKIDFPLVLKPGFASCGKGVFPNITDWAELKKAFDQARKIEHKYKDKPIIIEEYFSGRDFRILILEGKFVACCERVRPEIKGDGKSTVAKLIQKKLKDYHLKLDWEIQRNLKKQGVNIRQVIPKDKVVRLRENANISGGGISVDCTSEVCPKFKKIAEKCAQEFNGQLVGVDILTNDISDSKCDYRVIEINDAPGILGVHEEPDQGESEKVYQKVFKTIFNIK